MEELLDIKEVVKEVDLCRQTIRKKSLEGTFPVPVKLTSKLLRWKQSEIQEWKQNLQKAN